MATEALTKLVRNLRDIALRSDGVDLSDNELLDMFVRRRDEAAFAALVKRHGPMVMSVCRRVLGNCADAEDAFQAAFLVLARKASAIARRELLANWLYGVAHNVARKARAQVCRRRLLEKQVPALPDLAEVCEQPWSDVLPLLDRELSRLPAKYRSPIVLCHLEGKSHKQAAVQLGCPVGTVSGQLSRGKALLAQRLSRHIVGLSAGSLAGLLSQNAASASALNPGTISATTKAAMLFATGKLAVPGIISPHVHLLTNGVLKTMLFKKLATISAAVCALVLIGVPVGLAVHENSSQRTRTAKTGAREMPTDRESRQVASRGGETPDRNILKNAGVEEGQSHPDHWSQGATINGVEYSWDKNVGFKSKTSLCLNKTANRYFPIAQWYQVVPREGDSPEIQLSAQVKAEKATKAVLDLLFLGDDDKWIAHQWAAYIGAKEPNDPPADHDWKEYSGKVKIPPGTKKIQVGLQIYGPGKVWFDDIRAEYVK